MRWLSTLSIGFPTFGNKLEDIIDDFYSKFYNHHWTRAKKEWGVTVGAED